MAETPEGKALTEAYRRRQAVLREQTERRVRAMSRFVNVQDIDGSWRWRLEMQSLMADQHEKNLRLTERYVDQFALVENGRTIDVVRPDFDAVAVDRTIQIEGSAYMKKLIGGGLGYREAVGKASLNLASALGQSTLDAGRNLVDVTMRYHGRKGRYRRVTDGQPCAFCAMLAGRGPVYSEETAYFESHKHCGCTAEPVFRDWTPTEQEAQWIASYRAAAESADRAGEMRVAPSRRVNKQDRDAILYRMRRLTPDLFHDGVKPKI